MIKITEDNLDLILGNQKIPTGDDRDILLKLFKDKGKEKVLFENAMIIVNVFNYGRIRGKQIERERRGRGKSRRVIYWKGENGMIYMINGP